jgi:hypothetical protein
MKSLLGFFLLLGFGCTMAQAQNSVTISQKGNGNSVSVTQPDSNHSTGQNDQNCDKSFQKFAQSGQGKNKILVQKTGTQHDTLLNVAGISQNTVTKKLGKGELDASQYGRSNGLFIVVPDSQKNYHQFNSTQKGERNQISARLNKTDRGLNLSQNGSGNKVAINPCRDKNLRTASHHSSVSKVIQKGSGNSVSINQH